MHESTSTRPNGEERMLALSGTEPEEGPEVELWTRLHRTRVQDFANSVERLRQAAQALAVAVHYGYVEVAELVPTPAIALDDARMVGRLVAHIEGDRKSTRLNSSH